MRIETYGSTDNAPILFLHGMLTPLSAFHAILQSLSDRFFVIAPVLDGHDGLQKNAFENAQQQVDKISMYFKEKEIVHLHAAIGLSLGGVIGFAFWQAWNGHIDRLILDGAPLVGYGKLLTRIMTANYQSIVSRSRARDRKTRDNFGKYFLPSHLWEDYLLIADTISETSVKHIVEATAVNRLKGPLKSCDTAVLFLHGTAFNEMVSRQTAKRLKALDGRIQTHCFKGDAHCYKAIYEPQQWLTVATSFL